MFFELMEKSCRSREGWNEDLFQAMLKTDDDTMQEIKKIVKNSRAIIRSLKEVSTRTQASNDGSARKGGARNRTTTETGGNGEREKIIEARQSGERDETTNCSIRNEGWLR